MSLASICPVYLLKEKLLFIPMGELFRVSTTSWREVSLVILISRELFPEIENLRSALFPSFTQLTP